MPLELVIVTPQGEAFREDVESVVLPGSEGDFGVLPAHEHFLTPLRIGAAEIRTGREGLVAALADGFAQVSGDAVTVMVESCELADDIDVARAEHARERAEQGLRDLERSEDEARYAAFEEALARARNRLEVSQRQPGA